MTAAVDPYVRDGHGRFARLPDTLLRDVPPIPTPVQVDVEPPRPVKVRREANGAVLISDNPDVPNRHRVRVDRVPGGYRVTYLEQS